MPVFRYTGTPGGFDWSFVRGDTVSLVFPMADLVEDAYTTEVIEGVTLYTVVEPFDLTGMTFDASIGPKGGTPVCTPTVTHNDTGGEITIAISQTDSEATPAGRYTWELVDTTGTDYRQLLVGTVNITEGVLPR